MRTEIGNTILLCRVLSAITDATIAIMATINKDDPDAAERARVRVQEGQREKLARALHIIVPTIPIDTLADGLDVALSPMLTEYMLAYADELDRGK